MKNFIITSLIVLIAMLFLSGCYTILSLPESDYVPNYQPDITIIINNPPCIDCYPGPHPRPNPKDPGPIIVPYNPPTQDYKRPEPITVLRNSSEGRIPSTERKDLDNDSRRR